MVNSSRRAAWQRSPASTVLLTQLDPSHPEALHLAPSANAFKARLSLVQRQRCTKLFLPAVEVAEYFISLCLDSLTLVLVTTPVCIMDG